MDLDEDCVKNLSEIFINTTNETIPIVDFCFDDSNISKYLYGLLINNDRMQNLYLIFDESKIFKDLI